MKMEDSYHSNQLQILKEGLLYKNKNKPNNNKKHKDNLTRSTESYKSKPVNIEACVADII